jgi:holo-[acyl-carrier protein] synthase
MILGVGIDIVEIKRFELLLERPNFLKKYFSADELKLRIDSLAARYAAREAFYKALTEQNLFKWSDISVVNSGSGSPIFQFENELYKYASNKEIHLSLSHSRIMAAAFVLIEE